MKRVVTPELLDSDSGTPAEVAAALSDLRRINQWFGGIATTQSMIEYVADTTGIRSLSLLEVAAGAGDVPWAASERLKLNGIQVEVSLLDRASSHLKHRSNGTHAVAGDALALPFAEASFDLVSCSLFVHHLGPRDLVRFVNEGLRMCRIALLINDLIRNPLHLGLVYAGWPLYRSRLTQHDAPASVRAAYTLHEMLDMLRQTNGARVMLQRRYLYRMAAVVWK